MAAQVSWAMPDGVVSHSLSLSQDHTAFLFQLQAQEHCFWGDWTLSSVFLLVPVSQEGGHSEKRPAPASWSTLPLLLFSKLTAEGPPPRGKAGHGLIPPFSWGHRQKGGWGWGLLVAAAPCIRLLFPRLIESCPVILTSPGHTQIRTYAMGFSHANYLHIESVFVSSSYGTVLL